MNTVSLALSLTLVLTSVATAQKVVPAQPVKGGVRSFQIGNSQPKSTSAVAYSNTLWSGYYTLPGIGEEFIDWGDARPAAADHGTIIRGSFGYGTSAATGPTVRWRIYDGYTGWCAPRNPGGLDLSITGLPGNTSTTFFTAWIVGIDLAGAGACFYLPTGPFGYSMTFNDSMSGPLFSSGDSARDMFDWVFASTGSCGTYWFGGNPWCGFHTEFIGWKTSDVFGAGCNGPLSLGVTGNSCQGGALNVSLSGPGPDPAPFSAIGLGLTVGAGIGGPLAGGCSWDIGLAPGVPPASIIAGPLPVTLSLGATTCAGAAPGTTLCAQWVQKDRITRILSISNVVELFVP
ncbi:MAG: hypothetical protein V2A76_04950 [Planctomycetota bacterium]